MFVVVGKEHVDHVAQGNRSSLGMETRMVVPIPGMLITVRSPPSRAARVRIVTVPRPTRMNSGSKPTPPLVGDLLLTTLHASEHISKYNQLK